MKNCPNEQTLERWFDGELADDADVARHAESCPRCQDYVGFLRTTREVVSAEPSIRIDDAQMPSYLDDLRTRVHRRRIWGRVWAGASAAAAALVVAVSLSTVFAPGQAPAQAHSVIEAHSDIVGATTDTIENADGSLTVWLNLPEDDMQ